MFGLLMMCIYQNMGIWDIPVELTGKVVRGWVGVGGVFSMEI